MSHVSWINFESWVFFLLVSTPPLIGMKHVSCGARSYRKSEAFANKRCWRWCCEWEPRLFGGAARAPREDLPIESFFVTVMTPQKHWEQRFSTKNHIIINRIWRFRYIVDFSFAPCHHIPQETQSNFTLFVPISFPLYEHTHKHTHAERRT